MKSIRRGRVDIWLVAILLLSVFLNFYNMGNAGSNVYYTAAAKSMTANWKAFFFASLDPEGFITVDKPPVALWFQALSVAIFGVSDWSVLLPEAIAGVLATWMIYVIVKPMVGRVPALWSSLIFACTPIFVSVTRTNNIDTILIFTLLVAAWALMKSIHTQKVSWLFLSFALVGVGFNMKMLQAYMVLPAFYLFYFLASNANWKKRIKRLSIATILLVAISVSYAVIADSIPKEKRPYIGSSQTNSIFELAFGYNGIGRLTGTAGPGGNRSFDGNRSIPNSQTNEQNQGNASLGTPSQGMPNMNSPMNDQNGNQGNGSSPNPPQGMPNMHPEQMGKTFGPNGRMGGIGGETGEPGLFRLFNKQIAGQISWLLPFVLFSVIGLIVSIRKQRAFTLSHSFTVFWLAWPIPMMGFFSIAGFFHRYYLSMMAPAIAVLVAIGSEMLWEFYKEKQDGSQWLLPTAFLATFLFEAYVLFQNRSSIHVAWILFMALLGFSIFVLIVAFRNKEKAAYYTKIAGMIGLLIMPFYWSMTPVLYGGNSTIPYAGPDLNPSGPRADGMMRGMMGGRMEREVDSGLVEYLEKNYHGEKYLAATIRATTAAEIMLKTDKAVMAMGGFLGSDPVLTTEKLEEMVKKGEVKYFLVSGFGGREGNGELIQWIQTHCKEVPQEEWQKGQTSTDQQPFGMDRAEKLYKYEG